jgi:hypothetical protein
MGITASGWLVSLCEGLERVVNAAQQQDPLKI